MKQKSYRNEQKDTIIFMRDEETNEVNVQIRAWGYRRVIDFTIADDEQKKHIVELFEVKQ